MTNWFDEVMNADHKARHRVLQFPTQAVRAMPHRKALPDVYERNMGEPCDVRYLQAHLSPSEAVVDAPVASGGVDYRNSEMPHDRWCVSDVIPGQKDGE